MKSPRKKLSNASLIYHFVPCTNNPSDRSVHCFYLVAEANALFKYKDKSGKNADREQNLCGRNIASLMKPKIFPLPLFTFLWKQHQDKYESCSLQTHINLTGRSSRTKWYHSLFQRSEFICLLKLLRVKKMWFKFLLSRTVNTISQ